MANSLIDHTRDSGSFQHVASKGTSEVEETQRAPHRGILGVRPCSGAHHLRLLSHGCDSVMWPHKAAKEAGFCSLSVCLEGRRNEVGNGRAVFATACPSIQQICISVFTCMRHCALSPRDTCPVISSHYLQNKSQESSR